jgi:cysteinyl-tRNA synthetase
VTDVLVMFGLDAHYKGGEIGWSGVDIPELAKAYISPLSELRDQVRSQAIAGQVDILSLGRLDEKDNFYNDDQKYARALANFQRKLHELYTKNAEPKAYLEACDELRNTTLWDLGIYLEDREKKPALVRPLSASLREERRDRERRAGEKAAAKAKAQAEKARADAERAEKAKIDPATMFQLGEYKGKYQMYDARGIPTHEADGKEVAKAQSKKLVKLWEAQKKLFEKAQG